jgi:hypothetical protein
MELIICGSCGKSLLPPADFSGRRATMASFGVSSSTPAHDLPPGIEAISEAGRLLQDICSVYLRCMLAMAQWRVLHPKWLVPRRRGVWFLLGDEKEEEKDWIAFLVLFLGSFLQ